jgi:prevent-host-death family protein
MMTMMTMMVIRSAAVGPAAVGLAPEVAVADVADERAWSVAHAKAHLSELVDHAISDGPQAITRRGREVAIVVSAEEWHSKTSRPGSLAEFLAESPLRDSGIEAERVEAEARDAAL